MSGDHQRVEESSSGDRDHGSPSIQRGPKTRTRTITRPRPGSGLFRLIQSFPADHDLLVPVWEVCHYSCNPAQVTLCPEFILSGNCRFPTGSLKVRKTGAIPLIWPLYRNPATIGQISTSHERIVCECKFSKELIYKQTKGSRVQQPSCGLTSRRPGLQAVTLLTRSQWVCVCLFSLSHTHTYTNVH